jgi:pyruvate dehydrogenase E2 component (dihydrolipoamide acetyltransferase)
VGEFLMPSLGADMERGRLVEWLVKPGDYVHRGDIVAAVDTDKAVMDVETFEEGVVAELLAEVGTVLPVGAALARITPTPAEVAVPVSPPVRQLAHRLGVDTAGMRGTGKKGAVTREDVEHAAEQAGVQAGVPDAGLERRPEAPPVSERVRSSPRARRLAAELGVDLGTVSGTGPRGAVTETDVQRAAPAPPAPAPVEPRVVPAERPPEQPAEKPAKKPAKAPALPDAAERSASLRRAIGSLMSRSKKSIPHYYLSTTVDLRAALAWMQSANAGRPVASRLVPAALLLKASALAARDIPEVNGFYTDGEFHPSTAVHLGVAVALRQGGLVAPAIHDADTLPMDVLMERLRDLVGRARGGRLQRAEMADSTITVTNLGDLGVESVFGVIYPPQVALVGFGRVLEQPWAHDGMLGVRPAVTATLSADHRVSDGLRGSRFLARVDELLQKPEEL